MNHPSPILKISSSQAIDSFSKITVYLIVPQLDFQGFTMKVTALLYTFLAATAVSAASVGERAELGTLDVCGSGYGTDQRRTNSGCQSSNGDRHFCGCDRTGVVG